MPVLRSIRQFLWYAGVSPEEFERIRPEIRKNNQIRLMVFSAVTMFFLLVMAAITTIRDNLGFTNRVYLVSLVIFLAIFLFARFYAKDRPVLLKVVIYCFIGALYLFGSYIGTVARPGQTAGTFLAFLLAVPLLFVLRPVENLCLTALFDGIFVWMVVVFKEPGIVAVDVINGIIFGGISVIVSSFMLHTAVENFAMKDVMTRLAETDQLTQLRNRMGYEKNLSSYPARCQSSLACVYVDVNGLHELNDARGHAEGDVMLRYVAEALRMQFGAPDTYRIGGDEYVAFAADLGPQELERKLGQFVRRVQDAGYAVSVGWERQTAGAIDMSGLIRSAEQNMYADKQRFYSQPGRERRKRR